MGIVTSVGSGPAGMPHPHVAGAIYADVRLAPGNSGGPLADAEARMLGINSMVVGGVAVAIPGSAVDALMAGEPAQRSVLGVVVPPVALPAPHGRGLLVAEVLPGSAAEHTRVLVGDVAIAVDGAGGDFAALGEHLARLSPQRAVRIEVLRGGQSRSLLVVPEAAAA